MKANDVRQSFLDYFADRGHRRADSAPLVPQDDPTLLFVNAGMVPFKNQFLGRETPESPRAVSCQRCLRVSGKHNDLENVGPSARHHTFFEMLGNFSFGDYFKEDAIRFGWELVTEGYGLPPSRLFATVFREDDEAWNLWSKISTLPDERILRCGEKDNFWAMGDTGPCGPCSEIFVDLYPDRPLVDWEEGDRTGRYLEIWNLVFMQFERGDDGELRDLPNPSIDTGAGVERIASVLQGVRSNYHTDLFQPILRAAAELAGTRYGGISSGAASSGGSSDADVSLHVIADHLRAVNFLLADGVIPGNEGRGYVLRRILRRALRHGLRLGLEEPFLYRLGPVLEEVMGATNPQLAATRDANAATVQAEEEKFLATLASGSSHMQAEIEAARGRGDRQLSGAVVFQLYDTHGLPLEVIREIAEEERMQLDDAGYEVELEKQRTRSRQATGEGQKKLLALQQVLAGGEEATVTPFDGYAHTAKPGVRVERLARLGEIAEAVDVLRAGESGAAVLAETVFYAESGGQVADVGELRWPGDGATVCRATVSDVQKNAAGTFFHLITVEEGELRAGSQVDLHVDAARRRATERNHTATHLLHAVLRDILGPSVRQAGSLVAPDRLRFDFTCPRPVTPEQRDEIEQKVNHWVLEAVDTQTTWRDREEAIQGGAMALFGEKYGDRVRTVEIPGISLELCGGCHVTNTGQIGPAVVTAERGIASGVRRIEAVTGAGALDLLRERQQRLDAVAEALGTTPERAVDEVGRLRKELKERDAELAKLRMELVSGAASGGQDDGGSEIDGISVMVKEVPPAPVNELRNMADTLRSKQGSGVVVLGTGAEGKVTLIVSVSKDLAGKKVHAGNLVKALAGAVGGGGGGRPDFAQAGGKQVEKLPDALASVPDLVRAQLAG